ncbi:MAG TPA: hypothetical protein ENN38_00205 [Actinobacteria bacterium]|nr:hypothetical protein [Actinomycetota bacterium]
MKIKISKREQIMLISAVVLLVVVLFGIFVVMPKINQINDLKDQQKKENQKLESAKVTLDRLKALKKNSAKIEAEIAELNIKMPEDPELPSLLVEINKLAEDAGIDFITISPGEGLSEGENYSEIALQITITGRFFDLVDFLYRIRNHTREIKVNGLSISEGPKKLPHLSVSLRATAFVLK